MTPFAQIKHEDEAVQAYWSARELAKVLGYAKWDKFQIVIEKAKTACETSGNTVSDHFLQVGKMVTIGSGAEREVVDYHLSRYACYLIVQNADPEKPVVAVGQTYFATQTRAVELTQEQQCIELRDQGTERNKSLAAGAYEVGVVSARDFAIFTDHGYIGLYNGEKPRTSMRAKG
jgi:DNA-damage-inducible protein D